jgi:4'-phosphopantetheinyl transferase EntD
MADLAALAVAARGLLPATAAVAAADPIQPAPALWRGEVLPNAVALRQREFAAGRHAARQAMELLGRPAEAIPIGIDRAPVWPTGLNGSITHSATLCLAVVTQAPQLIGIDLEPATPLNPDLWDTILLPEECATFARAPDAPLIAKLIFSAKEAAYKAQYPRSKTVFGFEVIHITLGPTHFTARFTQAVPGFAAGSTLGGQYTQTQGHFLTVVAA